jgi:hypothetical protein
MVAGSIKAVNVRGTVKKVSLIDNTETPLQNGDVLIQENAIVTGPGDSSAILVFSNGSTVKVGNESRLEIKEFMMDPLQGDVPNVAALTNEPTVSRTQLRLEFGEMIGNVKTLNRAAGSVFSVGTPAGAAGIRGTTFRIVYRPTGDGQSYTFELSTSEGVVLFEGITQTGLSSINVPLGQTLLVIARFDPATNRIVVSLPAAPGGAPLSTVPLPAAAAVALQTTTLQIIQAQQQTTFTLGDLRTAQTLDLQQKQQRQNQPQPQPNAPGQLNAPGQQNVPGQPNPPGQPNGPGQPTTPGQPTAPGSPGSSGNPNSPPNLTSSPFQPPRGQPPPPPSSATLRTTAGDGR